MKKLLHNISFMFLFAMLVACDNNMSESLAGSNTSNGLITELGTYEFLYNGKHYSSNYEIVNDSMIFEDKSVRDVINEINSYKNVVTWVHPNEELEFITNFEEEKYLKASSTQLKSAPGDAGPVFEYPFLRVWEDSKLKGKNISYDCNGVLYDTYSRACPLAHKISSLDYKYTARVKSKYAIAALYYSPRTDSFGVPLAPFYTIYFSADSNEPYHYIHYLKSYKLYPGSSTNWNDKVQHVKYYESDILPTN